MRYRKLDKPQNSNSYTSAAGDYTFGHGQADFWVNVPDAVAQAALTRLYLFRGAWFLDRSDGTDWKTKVLGKFTETTRDPVIRARILGTRGINSIVNYSSNVNRETRQYSVTADIDTIYGPATIIGPI